jgi:hypothetical protein
MTEARITYMFSDLRFTVKIHDHPDESTPSLVPKASSNCFGWLDKACLSSASAAVLQQKETWLYAHHPIIRWNISSLFLSDIKDIVQTIFWRIIREQPSWNISLFFQSILRGTNLKIRTRHFHHLYYSSPKRARSTTESTVSFRQHKRRKRSLSHNLTDRALHHKAKKKPSNTILSQKKKTTTHDCPQISNCKHILKNTHILQLLQLN